ncbi:MAG: RNA polymerase subunit sigma-70, partial [Leptolyngbyaceae cyanobacterium bins.302]|nr:RNA polymerase subunit sigma-70 [Leptolyngbyaceae cyanobacterium bins.302]
RAFSGTVDWNALVLLYDGLIQLAPTLGAFVGRAAAIAEANGAEPGWTLLEALPTDVVDNYQPYWALKAHLLVQLGRNAEAKTAYTRAIGLVEDPAIRQFLLHQSLGC